MRRLLFLLAGLACVAAAAPAAASERSKVRRYAAAMRPKIVLTASERESLTAGVEARAAHVAATCLGAVTTAAETEARRAILPLYYAHVSSGIFTRQVAWMRAADERLARIPTRSAHPPGREAF